MRKKTYKFLAAALSCSIASAMLGGTAAYAADTQTGSPGIVAEHQLTADADMSKYFGEWVLYQEDGQPISADREATRYVISDDHSFKIDGKDYKWEVYEDGVRMQVLSMDDGGYGVVTMEDDTLVHYIAGSKCYYKRVENNVDADMSKYFGEWVLYQLDSKPVTSDQDAIKFSIKDDHSFKIDGKDYKWEVYEDGVRMQVLSMDDRGYGLIDIVGDTLVHDLADSKWYYKRVDADNSTTTEITTENSTDTGIVTTENATDSELTTENVTESETETTEIAADPEITTEIVTENATEETTLPETGMSGSHKVFAGLSALMGIAGIGLVKKSRKEE